MLGVRKNLEVWLQVGLPDPLAGIGSSLNWLCQLNRGAPLILVFSSRDWDVH